MVSGTITADLFLVKYLPIKGLSRLSYETYDERHIPKKFQRPHNATNGIANAGTTWASRPDHDKSYPDILIPIANGSSIAVGGAQSQAVFIDAYISKTVAAGNYVGRITVGGTTIPLTLTVTETTLPERSEFKANSHIDNGNFTSRFGSDTRALRDMARTLCHRHGVDCSDKQTGQVAPPPQEWVDAVTGQLYTPARGYVGPGEGIGNQVYSIGTYYSWNWPKTQPEMFSRAKAWKDWFVTNAPNTKPFLYLIDEPNDDPVTGDPLIWQKIESWAQWVKPSGLDTFLTVPIPKVANVPSVTTVAHWFAVAATAWGDMVKVAKDRGVEVAFYNGKRPALGSFAIEDDGVSPVARIWGMVKHDIWRDFYWEMNYWNDYQGGRGETDVWRNPVTFSYLPISRMDSGDARGETSGTYSNGDGNLFYPGMDLKYPASSLGKMEIYPSLRLKLWRRGIQDASLLKLALAKNPTATKALIAKMIKRSLWEVGVAQASDPTWNRIDIGWSRDPAVWEAARDELRAIIVGTP